MDIPGEGASEGRDAVGEEVEPTGSPKAQGAHDECQLCGVKLAPGTARFVSGHAACAACVEQLQAEVSESEAGVGSLPTASLGALVGALLGAAAWVGIVIATEYEVGYVAILVGFLAGRGTVLASGGRHGKPLQVLAGIAAVLGLLVAKYALLAHYVVASATADDPAAAVSYFDPFIVENFIPYLREDSSFFDALWIFFAVTAAWRQPASPSLHLDDS